MNSSKSNNCGPATSTVPFTGAPAATLPTALATSSELLAEDFLHLDPQQVKSMLGAMHRRTLWLQGLVEMRSISRFGLSQVTLVFDDHTDIYRARQLATERLQNVIGELPPGTQPKLAPITTGLGEVFFYTVDYLPEATNKPASRYDQLLELRLIQEWVIKPMLRSVTGVAEVNTSGGYEKQVVVLPNPEKMMSAGLSFDDQAVDPLGAQQMAQQQACRSATNDRDLRSPRGHDLASCFSSASRTR